jgi:hypothetical protein
VSEDVLKTYKFHVQIAEEDVRDGNANPWERVVTGLAAALRAERAGREEDKLCIEELADNLLNQLARVSELEAILSQETKRVAELERRLNPPCPDPSIDAFYLEGDKGET